MRVSIDYRPGMREARSQQHVSVARRIDLMAMHHCQGPARQNDINLIYQLIQPGAGLAEPFSCNVVISAYRIDALAYAFELLEDCISSHIARVHHQRAATKLCEHLRVQIPVRICNYANVQRRSRVSTLHLPSHQPIISLHHVFNSQRHLMPYFIYKVHPARQFESIDEQEHYRDARTAVRSMRAAKPEHEKYEVRMVFAATTEAAERLLRETREARPAGEDE